MDRLVFLSHAGTWLVGHQRGTPVCRWQPTHAQALSSNVGFTPAASCTPAAPWASRERLHLPWLQKELCALSWSCSSLYSQWIETGTCPTVPVTRGSVPLSRQHKEPKGFSCISPPHPKCPQLAGKKICICIHETEEQRLSPWGWHSPVSAWTQTVSKKQRSKSGASVGTSQDGETGWECFYFCTSYEIILQRGWNSLQARHGHGAGHPIIFTKALSPNEYDLARGQILPLQNGVYTVSHSTSAFVMCIICHLFIKKCVNAFPEVQSCFTAGL